MHVLTAMTLHAPKLEVHWCACHAMHVTHDFLPGSGCILSGDWCLLTPISVGHWSPQAYTNTSLSPDRAVPLCPSFLLVLGVVF